LRHQPGDVGIRRWWQAMEAQCPVRPWREHAVQAQGMEVHVQFQPAPEPLHDGDRAAAALGDPGAARPAAIPGEHRAHEGAEHRATERVVERQAVAQPMRDREHPLPHRHPGQDRVDEIRRLLGHAAAAAALADRAALARKRDETLEATGVAADARKAPLERPEALTEGLLKLQEKIQSERWLVRKTEPVGVRA